MMPELFGQSKGKSKCQILNNQIKKEIHFTAEKQALKISQNKQNTQAT